MIILKSEGLEDVQSAITELEDLLKRRMLFAHMGVWMTVAAGSTGVPKGAGVKMTANNTVDKSDVGGYIGINASAAAVAGGKVFVVGGPAAEALMIPGENPQPGNAIFYTTATPGAFSITPVLGSSFVATIYDRYQYNITTGGIVKVIMDIWHP